MSAGLAPATGALFPDASSNIGERIGGTIVQATVGGLASVAGGGKFANGAVTGAMQYLIAVSADPRMNANAACIGAACPPIGAGGGILDGLLGAAGRILGPLGMLLTLSGDTPQRDYLYHYTNAAGFTGIGASGAILPSSDGYVYMTPDTYGSGAQAQAALALSRTPVGY